jgi:ribosomal-protein-alanine N-acetyltransferase
VSEFDLKIKSLTPEHLPEMVQLDKACFDGLWTKSGYYRELTSPNSHFLGLSTPNFCSQLLGMGCFWSILEEAHITILAIHPQYHRQGLGQALLYSLLKRAGELGLSRATLEVRASNQGAISLYQKFGFKTAGRRPHYYQDNDEDALILWLSGLTEPSFSQMLDQRYIMINHRLKQSSWSINNSC